VGPHVENMVCASVRRRRLQRRSASAATAGRRATHSSPALPSAAMVCPTSQQRIK
jgi:hypothetical protein